MQLLSILSKLVSFKSISPNDGGSIDFIIDLLERKKFKCEKLIYGKKNDQSETVNLYAYYQRGNGPNLCFAGHVDVVPSGDLKIWKTNPFKATIKKEIIYGRGVSDMKGAIASYIYAINNFLEKFKNFKGTLSLLLTSDEEGEANFGTKQVVNWLERKNIKLDYCVVGEPTNPNFLGEMAKIGRRGSLNCKLKINGKQGHVGYPDRAKNPITDAIKFCNELKKPLDKGNKFFQPSNLEITSFDVDNKVTNLIPQSAYISFNVRFNDYFNSKSLIELIKKRLLKVGKNFALEAKVSGESFYNPSKELTKHLTSSVFETTGKTLSLSTTGGTSDARFISKICPVIEFGSVGKTMHQIDENVKISDLEKLSEIYFGLIKKIFTDK